MMNRRRALIEAATSKHSRLPDGYRELEWIGVDGTQWILTNYSPTLLEPYRVETKIAAENGTIFAFGCRRSTSSGQFTINLYARNNNISQNYGYRQNNTGTTTAFGTCDGSWNEIVIQRQNNTTTVVDVDGTAYSIGIANRSVSYPLALFGVYYNEQGTIGSISDAGKMEYLRFYDTNGLVREYIPAERTSDGEIGMYELVTEGFLTNAGTGVFRKGGYV